MKHIHLIPQFDHIVHETSITCSCLPAITVRDSGAIITHHEQQLSIFGTWLVVDGEHNTQEREKATRRK